MENTFSLIISNTANGYNFVGSCIIVDNNGNTVNTIDYIEVNLTLEEALSKQQEFINNNK